MPLFFPFLFHLFRPSLRRFRWTLRFYLHPWFSHCRVPVKPEVRAWRGVCGGERKPWSAALIPDTLPVIGERNPTLARLMADKQLRISYPELIISWVSRITIPRYKFTLVSPEEWRSWETALIIISLTFLSTSILSSYPEFMFAFLMNIRKIYVQTYCSRGVQNLV